jgi:hypothetical protein
MLSLISQKSPRFFFLLAVYIMMCWREIFLRFGSFLEEWFSFDENNVSWHQGKMMIGRLLGLVY